jgi:hypothetical protein
MLNPLKHKSLIVKMHLDSTNKQGCPNLLCDLELIIGLPCFLPMLEVVHILIKFVQHWNMFIFEMWMLSNLQRLNYLGS